MDAGFAVRMVVALAVIAVALVGLRWILPLAIHARSGVSGRLIDVVESTVLAPHASVHVVAVAGRYFLVGTGNAETRLIAELSADAIDTARAAAQPGQPARSRSVTEWFARNAPR